MTEREFVGGPWDGKRVEYAADIHGVQVILSENITRSMTGLDRHIPAFCVRAALYDLGEDGRFWYRGDAPYHLSDD